MSTALAIVAAILVAGRAAAPPPPPESDVDRVVEEFTGALSEDQEYRPPTPAEQGAAATGFAEALDHHVPRELTELGFSVRNGVDAATHRPFTAIVDEPGAGRAWGMYVIDRSAPPSLAVEVPHPASDLRTERFGVDLFRRVPGSVLLVAGAHRRAGGGAADVAHRPDTVFQAVAAVLVTRRLPQLQFHGFHDRTLPSADVVLSPGSSPPGDATRRAAARLTAERFAVCRAWTERCEGLEATTNVQGRLAAAGGTAFLHVEMSRTVRESPERRADLIHALLEPEPAARRPPGAPR
ncbi:hypothetical protein [Amycolatopsis sp. NPDC003861]